MHNHSHAINVIQNLVSRITSRNIKCLYNGVQNMYANNVIQNLVSGVTSRHIKCQYMRESNTHKNLSVREGVK